MRPQALVFAIFALLAAAGGSWFLAGAATTWVERETEAVLATALAEADLPWAATEANGLQVTLSGTAPSERARFRAVEAVIAHVSSNRLTDEIVIDTDPEPEPPLLALQILRADEETTLIGTATEGQAYERLLTGLAQRGTVAPPETGMVELLEAEEPEGWADSLALASRAANLLADAQISLSPGILKVAGTVEDERERDRIVELLKATPGYEALNVELLLSAPLPTLSPFRFALEMGPERTRLRDCAATSAFGQQAIVGALAGRAGDVDCPIAIGAPTEDWTVVVTESVKSLTAMEAGTLEIVNTDVALVSAVGAEAGPFEAEATRLREALPPPYTLTATLQAALSEDAPTAVAAPARFTAVRTDDGAVRMRGDLRDRNMQRTAASYAKAQFGFDAVVDETALRDDLPPLWYTHILAGLEALSLLNTGQVEVFADEVLVTGEVRDTRFVQEIRTMLTRKLPDVTDVALDIFVNPEVKKPVVSDARATLCEAQIETILSKAQITFPPGETEIDEASKTIIEEIARILKECPGARFEIGGHTDSQGRESSNLAISQARAVAVLNALIDMDVRQVFLVAQGYGEAAPIADNETEEGRAANRRIEFRLKAKEDAAELEEALDGEEAATDAADAEAGSALTDIAPTGSTGEEAPEPPAGRLPQIGDGTEGEAPAPAFQPAPRAASALTPDAPPDTAPDTPPDTPPDIGASGAPAPEATATLPDTEDAASGAAAPAPAAVNAAATGPDLAPSPNAITQSARPVPRGSTPAPSGEEEN
ncbi:MAG: OmpA family protein [Pseudomonadota bacterium]